MSERRTLTATFHHASRHHWSGRCDRCCWLLFNLVRLLQLLQRSDSLPAGRLHTWWSTFDARYMQPVFGGAPQHTTAAVELLHRNSRTDQSDT